jgi:chemotaxis protein MotB
MKNLILLICSLSLFACVSSKKFKSMQADYKRARDNDINCEDLLSKQQALNSDLTNQKKDLQAQIDYLKNNSSQVLNALQDMSVLSGKQAESVKKSLESLNEKDAYIKNLQSAISRKDSLNMVLVMNLKGSLADVNDKDINIKVDKGVVFIDISDKMLFNSGKYEVSKNAKTILGKIASILNAHPELDVMVEGHTDSIPIHNEIIADNWDLSVKRATAVVRILEKEYNISPTRMTAAGHGKYIPVSTNATVEGRSLNRRTRIVILPQLDQFFKLMTKNEDDLKSMGSK